MKPTVDHIEYSIPLGWQSACQKSHAIIQCTDLGNLLHSTKNEKSQNKMLLVWRNDNDLAYSSVLKEGLVKEGFTFITSQKPPHTDMRSNVSWINGRASSITRDMLSFSLLGDGHTRDDLLLPPSRNRRYSEGIGMPFGEDEGRPWQRSSVQPRS